MINKTINGYTIKHLIGSGGMADVYYAENKLGKKAAIKVLKSELCAIGNIKERFEQEARIMVDIEHKHIRQAYDLDEINGQPAIIMEYLEGHTLKQLIDKGKISDEQAKKYFEQCVSALKVTHAKEIVHRDIKPSNIFITNDDEVKIMDFGIAKVAESGLGTRTNQMLGTPVYMSPEQIKSPKNVGIKSDVYSLAVTFYHALTGKVPYDSTTDSDFEIQSKIVHEDLDLSRVSSSWVAKLMPMLLKDAEKRMIISLEANERTIFDTVQINHDISSENLNGSEGYRQRQLHNTLHFYFVVYKRAFDFKGRSSLSEFWYFHLISFVIHFLLIIVFRSLFFLNFLIYIFLSISLGIRRMHDLGKSGWNIIFPFYNIYLFFLKGDTKPNKHGEVPI